MTLPASGTMNAIMISEEYYKIPHADQDPIMKVVDISVMSVRYNVAGATVGYDDFYDGRVIDASIWRWWDLGGSSHLGQAAGSTGDEDTDEFLIDPCFGGFSASPNINLRIDWSALDINYTKVVNNCTIDFEYDKGAGFVNLTSELMDSTGSFSWGAAFTTLFNITPTQAKSLRFRFAYTFSGTANDSDIISLNNDFSFVIRSTTGAPVYVPRDTSTWKITQFQSDGAGNIDWNATSLA